MVKSKDTILVGDIGGTNARFALATLDGADITLKNFKKYKGDDFASLQDTIALYLKEQNTTPYAASLAVAGPIHKQSVRLTNRDWEFSKQGLEAQFGFDHVAIYNDFSAMARSVLLMDDDSFEMIYDAGDPDSSAPIIVAGPGTGFGMGIVITDCAPPHVLPTEGGHQAYAPMTKAECEILEILRRDNDFVSLELLCSGSGMDKVHKAICERRGVAYEQLSPAVVLEQAKAGDEIALAICEIRSAAVMGALGDMALATGALGGVVIAGGVSERLIDYIAAPKALERFFNRGPRSDYMKSITIRLLKNDEAPLFGAAALYQDQYETQTKA